MARYTFTARDARGRTVTGSITAWSSWNARQKINAIKGWRIESVTKDKFTPEHATHETKTDTQLESIQSELQRLKKMTEEHHDRIAELKTKSTIAVPVPPPPPPPTAQKVPSPHSIARSESKPSLPRISRPAPVEKNTSQVLFPVPEHKKWWNTLFKKGTKPKFQPPHKSPARKPETATVNKKHPQHEAAKQKKESPPLPSDFAKVFAWIKNLYDKAAHTEIPPLDELIKASKLLQSIKDALPFLKASVGTKSGSGPQIVIGGGQAGAAPGAPGKVIMVPGTARPDTSGSAGSVVTLAPGTIIETIGQIPTSQVNLAPSTGTTPSGAPQGTVVLAPGTAPSGLPVLGTVVLAPSGTVPPSGPSLGTITATSGVATPGAPTLGTFTTTPGTATPGIIPGSPIGEAGAAPGSQLTGGAPIGIPYPVSVPVPGMPGMMPMPAQQLPRGRQKKSFLGSLSGIFGGSAKKQAQTPWKFSFGSYFKKQTQGRMQPQSMAGPVAAPGTMPLPSSPMQAQEGQESLRQKLMGSFVRPKVIEQHVSTEDITNAAEQAGRMAQQQVQDMKAEIASQFQQNQAQQQTTADQGTSKRTIVLEGFQKKPQPITGNNQQKGIVGTFKEDIFKRKQDKQIKKFKQLNFRQSRAEHDRQRKKEEIILKGYRKTGNPIIDFFGWLNDLLLNMTRVSTKNMVTFFNLLSVMVNAGIPLIRALQQLVQHTENPKLKKILYAIVFELENGSSLSEAMSKFNKVFNDAHIGMVETGEASGQLGDILKQIAHDVEKQNNLISKVRGALIYPATIMIILIIVGVIVMTLVVPKITEVFAGSNVQLPLSTRILIAASSIVRNYWYLLLLGIGMFILAFKAYGNTSEGKYYIDFLKIRIPIFGKLLQKVAIARFARSLSTLSQSGLSIIKALVINADSIGNELYRQEVLATAESVKKGIGIAQDLEGNKLFPPIVVNMIAVGEETAQVGPISGKIADFYEEEVDDAVKNISALIEPIIVVVIGVGVGFMVAAIMQPIMQIADVATSGG